MATFTAYMRKQRRRFDQVGDFARDWTDDVEKPRGVKTWSAIKSHLESMAAGDLAIAAGRRAWREYRKTEGGGA